jgi:hypothetical protein
MVRRILFIAITFGLKDQSSLQIHLFTACTLVYIGYLGLVVPHYIYFTTVLELANETVFVLICYNFILLTDITSDRDLRFNLGWFLVALVLLIMATNFAIIINVSVNAMKWKYKLGKQRSEFRQA